MFRRILSRNVLMEAGERARRAHSLWLTHHLVGRSRIGGGDPGRAVAGVPDIPSRKVVEGGFDELISTPLGKAWAEDWWNSAMERAREVE